MRHVTRTHLVVLDRLFERINLGANMSIRYVNPKEQIADMHQGFIYHFSVE